MLTEDGWFRSADLAHLHNGAACIAGRTDDVLIVAGRNLDARALDAVVSTQAVCRPGNAACFSDGAGRYVVVAEPSVAGADVSDLRTGAREIRAALTQRFAAAPSEVVFIERLLAEDAERQSPPQPPAWLVGRRQVGRTGFGLERRPALGHSHDRPVSEICPPRRGAKNDGCRATFPTGSQSG